jgi:NAD(P)-dependent dehydrogenase (short-subunit alcohol dehydrogenase family)
VAAFGRLDCAFNNAGIAPRNVGPAGQRTHEMSRQSFDAMLAVNLTGVFLCLKHEIVQMLAQGGGAIVNTASIAGLVGLPTASNYVAAKHGVVGITKTAAMEYAQDNMAERYELIMTKVPMHRLGVPEEIAEAVVWMCSDKASFMTGASHVIDGGYYAA